MSDCIFCKNLPKIIENDLAYAVYDINPKSKGHVLIISKRHFEQIFDATPAESAAIKDLIIKVEQHYGKYLNYNRRKHQAIQIESKDYSKATC